MHHVTFQEDQMPQIRKHEFAAARQASYRRRCSQARLGELSARGLPALPAVPTIPGKARWRQAIASADALLSMVEQEMNDYYNDRSETWREGQQVRSFRNGLIW